MGNDAPKKYRIYREEIYLQILEQNKKAAAAVDPAEIGGLDEIGAVWDGLKCKTASGEKKDAKDDSKRSGFSRLKSSSPGVGDNVEVVVKRKKKN